MLNLNWPTAIFLIIVALFISVIIINMITQRQMTKRAKIFAERASTLETKLEEAEKQIKYYRNGELN